MIGVHLQDRRVDIRKAKIPKRPQGFALIRLLAGGICNTDLELQRGYYGFRGRPGHEFVGEVVESDTKRLGGKRVVGEINLACGRCEMCAAGLGRHCPARTVLGIVRHPGAFAEFLTLPDENLHAVPGGVTTERAVFVEPVAAACEILEQVKIPKGARAAVLGDGKLGLLIAQVLAIHGVKVVQFGRHREKLAISASAGVTVELRKKRLPCREFDFVVDATGSAAGLQSAIDMTRPRGTVILKSTVHGAVSFNAATAIVNEVTLVGSRCGRFEPALRILPKLKLDEMIAARFPLSEAPAAFEHAASKGVLKVLLTPP